MTRREFPASIRRAALARAGGRCECHRLMRIPGIAPSGCSAILVAGRMRYEHITPDQIGGEPTLENCAVLTVECWRIKTDRFDLPTVAKTKRMAAKHAGEQRRSSHPMPGSRASRWRKPFNGKTERRTP